MSDIILSRANQLKLNNIQVSDLGDYVVTIKNATGEITSKKIQVAAAVAPTIDTDLPASQSISENATVTLEITLSSGTGLPSPTYQWKKDGLEIPGATSSTYSTLFVRGDSGNYLCVVTNKAGTVSSTTNTILVTYGPEITSQPTPATQTVSEGGAVVYEVVASGAPAPTYQWKKDGVSIGGETSSVLVLSSLTTSDSGSYTCEVTVSGEGTLSTTGVTLLVIQNLPIFTVQPVSDVVAPAGSVTFSAQTDLAVLSFTWKKAGVAINAADPDVTVTSDVGAGTTSLQIENLSSGDAGAYTVSATNASGVTTSDIAVLSVSTEAPSISAQPSSQVAISGATVQFIVTADSAPAPTYQWYKDTIGNPLADAGDFSGVTTNTLSIANAEAADEASYFVRVTNPSTTEFIDSEYVVLGIEVAPVITVQPTSQQVDEFDNATYSVTATGTNLQYQWYQDPAGANTLLVGANSSTLIIYGAETSDTGKTYRCIVQNGIGSVNSDTVGLTVSSPVQITSNLPSAKAETEAETLTLTISATGTSPLVYVWKRGTTTLTDGVSAGVGTISGATTSTLSITNLASAAGGSFTCEIDNSHSSVAVVSNACVLTIDALAAPSFSSQPSSASVAAGGSTSFTVTTTGNPSPTHQWQYDDGVSGFQNLVEGGTEGYNAYANATAYVANDVVSFGGQVYKCLAGGTSNTTDPNTDTGCVWEEPLPAYVGVTSASLSLPCASSTLTTFDYRCVATNSQGSSNSNAATLTVT